MLAIASPGETGQAPIRSAGTRKAATVTALVTYPVFYHSQAVRVRAAARLADGVASLESEGARVWYLAEQGGVGPGADTTPAPVEVVGTFVDVGRLEPADPRAPTFAALSERVLRKNWPGVGELLVLLAERTEPVQPFAAPSVRALALDPSRYLDQEVTVVGRFRGRNLYADLPDAPGESRWDFVLQSADAAVWVTGRRPRGEGFDLNLDSRVDTGRWLEVAGLVKRERGLVYVAASAVRAAQPPAQTSQPEAVVNVPVNVAPPEVVFSAPTHDETDVATDSPVRIQFSRDMKGESFKDRVTAAYVGSSDQPPTFTTTYDGGRRMLLVKFSAPLESFKTLTITLGPGIVSGDGQPLAPWTLTFSTGPPTAR
jgi:hypothetical protein